MKKAVLIYLLLLNLSFAQENNTTTPWLDTLTQKREDITISYHETLCEIDSFLSKKEGGRDQTYNNLIEKSRIQLIFSTKTREEKIRPALYIKAKIILPKTKDKLEITFNKQTEDKIDNQNLSSDYEDSLANESMRVGLRYYLIKNSSQNIYTKIGLNINSPFDLFSKLSADKIYCYEDIQLLLDTNLYYYIYNSYFTTSSAVTFIRLMSFNYTIEQKNQIYYTQEDKSSELEHIIRLHNYINKKNQFTYSINYVTAHEDDCNFCKKRYGLSLKFRHYLKKWLFIETIPQVIARRENHFNIETMLTLNIGITFSKKPSL